MNDLINKDLICLDIEANSKEEVIKTMANLMDKNDKLFDLNKYIEKTFDREKEFPTAVGYGVAIPHGKTSAVKKAALAFVRLKNEISWSEDEKVKYIFLIAVSDKEAGDRHLKILSELARKIMREEFRKRIANAITVEDMLEILQ